MGTNGELNKKDISVVVGVKDTLGSLLNDEQKVSSVYVFVYWNFCDC